MRSRGGGEAQDGYRGSPRWEGAVTGFLVVHFMPARAQGRKEMGHEGGDGEEEARRGGSADLLGTTPALALRHLDFLLASTLS